MTDQSPTLQHWLDRLRAGDPAARNELIRHCRDRLRDLTRRMLRQYPRVREWEETSDVLQNVLVRLDRALRDVVVPSPGDLLRLSAALIRRELIDLSRSLYGPRGLGANLLAPGDLTDTPDVVGAAGDDPFQISVWHEFHRCIDEQLTDDDRVIVELHLYHGFSQAEVAAHLGLPQRTFNRRWQAIRLRLAERFGADWT